jgi:S1-C subfamily serine protease
MAEHLAGVAMLAIFALAAALMYARALPALLAVPLMALAIAAVAGAGLAGLQTTIVDGTTKLAPVIVTVVFGALLSRVTLSTGIAETIVTYAAEFGGDRPALLSLALSAAVAVLFTSLTGLGAIIMVGSIVLPIMLTIGVPRKTAATLFMLAFALGFIFNIAQWTFYTKTFGVERAQMQPFAYALAGLDALALVAFAVVRFRASRGYATWAVALEEPLARKRAPAVALVTPVLPIVLYFALGMNPIVAFALAALFGALSARPQRAIETLVASAIRGVEDVAPAVLLFMGIGMLLVATGLPSVKAALAPLVSAIAPRSWLGYVVLFGVFSPLALYRGPLNPFGVGIAVYTVLAGLGTLPAVTLVAAIMAVVQVQNVCDPTNTQNVWVANFSGVRVDEITKLTLPYQTAVAIAATFVVVVFGGVLLGTQPFTLGTPANAAQTMPSGMFAPASAMATLRVYGADDPASVAAVRQLQATIERGWKGFRTVEASGDPAASDCAHKPYVAALHVVIDADEVGLELADCAGWPVDQWYVARTGDVRQDALAVLFQVRTWMVDRPDLARGLFSDGLAYQPRDGPTYFYSLFKTVDGEMRAYVRPGGPAYAAGLRTNDIVEKLDGKYWWEYGTFQTQARAYDGLPHTFDVIRGPANLTITLGEPFRG